MSHLTEPRDDSVAFMRGCLAATAFSVAAWFVGIAAVVTILP